MRRRGVHIIGADASVSLIANCNASACFGWGFWDESSAGNTYFICMGQGNLGETEPGGGFTKDGATTTSNQEVKLPGYCEHLPGLLHRGSPQQAERQSPVPSAPWDKWGSLCAGWSRLLFESLRTDDVRPPCIRVQARREDWNTHRDWKPCRARSSHAIDRTGLDGTVVAHLQLLRVTGGNG